MDKDREGLGGRLTPGEEHSARPGAEELTKAALSS